MLNNIDIKITSNIVDSMINILPVGIIIVNNAGSIETKNHFAEKIIKNTHVLSITNNKLKINHYISSIRYKSILSNRSSTNIEINSTLISIPENNYNKIELFIPQLTNNTEINQCCIFLRNPKMNSFINKQRIEYLYNLTNSESVVAVEITMGLNVTEIAKKLCIQENTVRTHLKRIYRKTNTNNQSNLVSLLANNLLLNLFVVN